MSLTGKTANNPNADTLALWRAAEAGELSEVEAALARVADVNARNEHGVTALMRAAQHGHVKVVRLLLAHGADANVIRNDKFTALSLAAFFGHTDVVKALMEHGADSQASTRHGTSPHMWAKARTFKTVVAQLEKPAPETTSPGRQQRPTVQRQVPAPPMTFAKVPAAPPVVHTLKDPPEIWDLVHEVPKGFNARAAFVTRLRSMRLTFRLVTAAGLIGACVVGVLVLRGVDARSEVTVDRQPPASAVIQNEKRTLENAAPPAVTAPVSSASSFVAPTVVPVATHDAPVATQDFKTAHTRKRNSHSRVFNAPEAESNFSEQPAPSETVQKIAAAPETSDVKVRPSPTTQTKSSSPLSPQLITPAKNVSPKSKVIQWP